MDNKNEHDNYSLDEIDNTVNNSEEDYDVCIEYEEDLKNNNLEKIVTDESELLYFLYDENRVNNFIEKVNTQDLWNKVFKTTVESFSYIPDEFKTKQMCAEAIQYDSFYMDFVPEKFIDVDLIKLISNDIRKNYSVLNSIPKKFYTPEICKYLLKLNSKTIQFFPPDVVDDEDYIYAITDNIDNIKWIPDKFKTDEICQAAYKKSKNYIIYLRNDFVTREIYNEGLTHYINKRNVQAIYQLLNNFSTELADPDVVVRSISDGKYQLSYKKIPKELMTEKVKYKLIEKHPYLLTSKEFNKQYNDSQFLKDLVLQNPRKYFRYIPKELKTREFCIELLKKKPSIINLIPRNYIDIDLYNECRDLLIQNFNVMYKDFRSYITEDLLKELISQNYNNYQLIPEDMRTLEIKNFIFNILDQKVKLGHNLNKYFQKVYHKYSSMFKS